jgi:putative DNA primase/helicase
MTAEILARARGGRRTGNHWMAPCPTHEDREPSLSIRDAGYGKVLVHCHAGCEQSVVIGELRSRGLWGEAGEHCRRPTRKQPPTASSAPPAQDDSDRTAIALRLWRSTVPSVGTPVATYLHLRGISLAAPDSIRFHPHLKHPSGGNCPGMVALVTGGTDGEPLAIHRTFLARDGAGKAPVTPQKMMLGPCRGGAVRLGTANRKLMVGEGVETCLAAMQATAMPAWAALSTSGLRTLQLPAEIRKVIILADGDEPGETAARDAALRWKREGRTVRIARPPTGMDFNDILLGRDAREEEGVPNEQHE